MATIYVRSTDGNNADDGSTWALAKENLAGACAIDSAGDTIYISDAHAYTTPAAANVTFAFAGTATSPVIVIGGDDAAEPPTAITSPATGYEATTGTGDITITGSVVFYNVKFLIGAAAGGAAALNQNGDGGHYQAYHNCIFEFSTTAAAACWQCGGQSTTAQSLDMSNCTIKFNQTSNAIVWRGDSTFHHVNLDAAGAAITNFITTVGTSGRGGGRLLIDGCDLSSGSSTMQILPTTCAGTGAKVIVRNCKIPASATLAGSGITSIGYRAEMWNCDSGDTNYKMWIEDIGGSIKQETTLVRTGGASDGDTAISWKMASSASAAFTDASLATPEIFKRNTTTGSAVTLTIEILHDSATNLQNDEIWMEVEYLGTSGVPLGAQASDSIADILASPADQTDSSETWTTTGMTNPNTQKLNVTFTPQEKGVFICRVVLAKASTTVYVDPKVTAS